MPVKPQPGETVRQTIDTVVIPASTTPGKAADLPTQSDFMDWIENQPREVWEARKITITLRRGTESNKGPHCIKLYAPPDRNGPFSMEWVRVTYGGGDYRLLANVDGQLRYNIGFSVIGQPKEPEFEVPASQSQSNSEIGMILDFMRRQNEMFMTEMRAQRGGDAGTQAIRDAMSLSTQVLSTAVPAVAQIVSTAAGGGPHAPNPMEGMMVQFMTAMMTKMMQPEQSGLAQTLELITKLKDSGLVANPGGGKTDLGTTLVSMAPQVLGKLNDMFSNFARMKEADVQAMKMGQAPRQLPAAPPQVIQQPNPPPANRPQIVHSAPVPDPPPPPQQPPAQPAEGQTFMDSIEYGIVNVLSDPGKPLDDAAHEILIFLDVSGAGQLVDQLIVAGPDALLNLFKTRPILMNVPQNPRLTEFIAKFLQMAKESREEPAEPREDTKPDGSEGK